VFEKYQSSKSSKWFVLQEFSPELNVIVISDFFTSVHKTYITVYLNNVFDCRTC